MMSNKFPATILQDNPRVYLATIPGKWLLKNTSPSWRKEKPAKGFQRMVTERRAREIASAVLDQQRSFPNAIVLATDSKDLSFKDSSLQVPDNVRYLIVDGQHRLWAQQYSLYEAKYGCVIHAGLTIAQMAAIFVEINDNQKRVPSSLRWDLVRLVKPESDPGGIRASELVESLNTEKASPLFQRIDMTGEQPEITIKQGSLAPEIRKLVVKKSGIGKEGFDVQLQIFMNIFAAIREKDPDGWSSLKGDLYKARVLRAFLQLIPEFTQKIAKDPKDISPKDFFGYVKKVNLDELSEEKIKAVQGNAGIAAIRETIRGHIFEK